MKFLLSKVLSALALLLFSATMFSQEAVNLTGEQVVEKLSPTVVSVLTSPKSGMTEEIGTGIIVSKNGVILCAYHTVKAADKVQIRLKSGEIYDKVDLIAFDDRRDIAALKIAGSNLPFATIPQDDFKIGGKTFVIGNPQNKNWSVLDGKLMSFRLADEIPSSGSGFKVLQVSTSGITGSTGGGVLTDEKGQAIGLIISSIYSYQTAYVALPLSNLIGLGDSTQTLHSFNTGSELAPPQPVRPPVANDVLSVDRKQILSDAKILWISSNSELISDKMMENQLMKYPEYDKWNLAIVTDWNKRQVADIEINLEHDLFTFNYRYTMTDRRTSVVLASGKVTVWDGNEAAKKFTKEIIEKLRKLKEPTSDKKPKTT